MQLALRGPGNLSISWAAVLDSFWHLDPSRASLQKVPFYAYLLLSVVRLYSKGMKFSYMVVSFEKAWF